MKPTTIAIDGPAASGKSTLGAALAGHLGYLYFDTGVMYRAVTWAALERSISIDDEQSITRLAEAVQIDVQPSSRQDGRQYDVICDGVDVTWQIREPRVDASVSPISAYAGVRRAMVIQQRRIGLQGNVVMVGRDIGTVVLPEAQLKIYLDAAAEERARRRSRQTQLRGPHPQTYEEILAAMKRRDHIDSHRHVSPLKPAPDAVIIDSTHMNVDDVVRAVTELIQDS
jgi:cytidylate kinase